MKFALTPLHGSGDPLGYEPPAAVEVTDTSASSRSTFRFAPEESFLPATPLPAAPPDPFAGLGGAAAPASRIEKIDLVSAKDGEQFAGMGDSSQSTSSLSDKINLAPLAKGDGYFEAFDAEAPTEEEPDFTKGATDGFHKFCQFTKVQETGDGEMTVWGVATHEKPDLDGEICDYDTAKRAYQDWSTAAVARTSSAGQQISLGPIRYQHSTEPAGKATKIQYDDDAKEIWLGSVPISDDIRKQLQEGFLTGYSQGGSYAWRKCTDCGKNLTLLQANNFCPACKKQVPVQFGLKRLSEVSYVDSPCTGKGFEYVKRDGTSKFVSFTKGHRGPAADGVIYRGRRGFVISKQTIEVDGRKRTVVTWPNGVLVA